LRDSKERRCRVLFLSYSLKNSEKTYCALGTIAKHNGIPDWQIALGGFVGISTQLAQKYGLVNKPSMVCPICDKKLTFLGLIAHLNDTHNSSWGEIADFLEIAKPYDNTKPLYNKIIDAIKSF